MKFSELTKEQVRDLKRALLLEREDSVAFADFCRADELVGDEELIAKYGDDFPA